MDNLWLKLQAYFLDPSTAIANPILIKGAIAFFILLLSQILKQLFFSVIFKRIEQLTNRTNTSLDDELLDVLKSPLGWLLFFIALWFIQLVVGNDLNPNLSHALSNGLGLLIVIAIAYTLYRLAPLLGRITAALTLRTDTELDDLIVPYLPKLFQTAAILIIILKSSEVLLGVSATALVGILGGAGIAFGLLIKDVIFDWCCTVIIYVDNLYRTGDQLMVSGIDGPVQVLEIGLRSTKLGLLEANSIKKIPNSNMIAGIVENRSQKMTQ